jgi:hypothetical protein
MNALIEMFPFVFGVLLGLTWVRMGGPRRRIAPWAIGSLALGAFATLASGEWRESIVYFLFDIGLVAIVSIATTFVLRHWQRWRSIN